MREQTIAMYCFFDDLLRLTCPSWARPAGPRRPGADHGAGSSALFRGQPSAGPALRGTILGPEPAGQERL